MVYECEPGRHLFWARSENKSFIAGELQPDRIYFLEAVPDIGALKSGVQLYQITPKQDKRVEKMLKFIRKKEPRIFTEGDLSLLQREMEEVVARGLSQWATILKNNQYNTLDPASFIEIIPAATEQ